MNCEICFEHIDESLAHPHPFSLAYDHIRQRIAGGSDGQENLRPVHWLCNATRPRAKFSERYELEGYTRQRFPSCDYYTPIA